MKVDGFMQRQAGLPGHQMLLPGKTRRQVPLHNSYRRHRIKERKP